MQEFLIICEIYRFGLKTVILSGKIWRDDKATGEVEPTTGIRDKINVNKSELTTSMKFQMSNIQSIRQFRIKWSNKVGKNIIKLMQSDIDKCNKLNRYSHIELHLVSHKWIHWEVQLYQVHTNKSFGPIWVSYFVAISLLTMIALIVLTSQALDPHSYLLYLSIAVKLTVYSFQLDEWCSLGKSIHLQHLLSTKLSMQLTMTKLTKIIFRNDKTENYLFSLPRLNWIKK